MLEKNMIVTAQIQDYTSDGNGVAKYDNVVIFVPNTVVGDICDIKITKVLSGYCFGICEKIITPSPDRIIPVCPISKKCGGCNFQHINYTAEKSAKRKFTQDAFNKIGKFNIEVSPIKSCDEPYRYRNKARFPLSRDKSGKAVFGFFARRSHNIIPCEDCVLQPKVFSDISKHVVGFINKYKIPIYPVDEDGIVRHILLRISHRTKEIMLCIVCKNENLPYKKELTESLVENFPKITTVVLNINKKDTNVILGDKNIILYGSGKITDTLCGVKLEISPASFYQVNHDGAENLYKIAKNALALKKSDILLDLYCGTGAIGLSMADSVQKLIGVEIIPRAVADAIQNAKAMKISNAEFICADAGKASEFLLKNNFSPSAIVLDPPRKGCDESTLNAIIKMSPEKIAMISCNVATAARDCKFLCENGYKLNSVQPFDMFPRTKHVECVALMSRVEN
jgi:23S rRNA (uracil1939-C5)-methyltransferase